MFRVDNFYLWLHECVFFILELNIMHTYFLQKRWGMYKGNMNRRVYRDNFQVKRFVTHPNRRNNTV